jgi:hypothetical protein
MLFNVVPFLDVRNQFVIIVTALIGYYIKRYFFAKKSLSGKRKNPFSHDSRSSLTPLVIEQEKRNHILKKGMKNSVLELKRSNTKLLLL